MNEIIIKKPKKYILPKDANKYSRGVVAVNAGSRGFAGAAFFAAKAAMLSGAGLVKMKYDKDTYSILSVLCPEAVFLEGDKYLKNASSHIIGPGLVGKTDILNDIPFDIPTVIDAEGINALKDNINILERFKVKPVLTPHIGEFSRLTGITFEEILKNKAKIAYEFSKSHNAVLVLKGENTIVADGKNVYVNKVQSPVLATAGSGDVLSGIIAALLAKGEFPVNAACNAVYIHGLLGKICEKEFGNAVTATTLLHMLPKAFKK